MSHESPRGRRRWSLGVAVATLALAACGDPSDPRQPNVNFAIHPADPVPTQVVEAEFIAAVTVTSALEIASVTSQVGDHSAELVYSTVRDRWEAQVDFGETPSPSDQTIAYTATDVAGNTVHAEVPVRLDRLPVVTLTAPLDDALATPSLRVAATCSDDAPGGCAGLTILAWSGHGFILAEASGQSVDAEVDLSMFEGTDWYDGAGMMVYVQGHDAERGDTVPGTTPVFRTVYVDGSAGLVSVAGSGTGRLMDASATHLLTADGGRLDSAGIDTLRLVDRASGQSTVLHEGSGDGGRAGALFPGGAIFLAAEASGSSVKEWRGGVLTTLATGVTFFRVNGPYALWRAPGGVFRRELTGGTTTAVAADVGATEYDVAATGEVAWASAEPYEIHLVRNGTDEPLTDDGADALRNGFPRTDGAQVVYQRSASPPDVAGAVIMLSGPGGEIALSEAAPCIDARLVAGRDYRINGGWVAFVRTDEDEACTIWRRSPTGEETRVDDYGAYGAIELVGGAGEIVFTRDIYRYLVPAGGDAPVRIGTALGRRLFIEGQLHVLIGSTLLRVD